MPHDLIVFGEDWGGLPSSTQHLISHLAKDRKIVWVNSIGLRRPKFNFNDIKRVIEKIFFKKTISNNNKENINRCNENTNNSNNFFIVQPKTIPAPRSRLIRWLAARLIISQVKPIIQKANIKSPILWLSLPTAVDIVGQLGESSCVYYCGDDFSGLAGVDHSTIEKREKELVKKSDIIFCASENIALKLQSSKAILLPHGVNYSLFSTPLKRASDLPDDGKPIAGFYGSISEWLDIDMLYKTIKQLPDWNFVFIGKAVVNVEQLKSLKNVLFLGERSHAELPSYSQHWTASILPFINNAQIRACNPLKLSEYLATGKPIISTSFPAIEKYRGLIQIAENSETMIEALKASVFLKSITSFQSALQNTVSDSSWESRAEEANQWIDLL